MDGAAGELKIGGGGPPAAGVERGGEGLITSVDPALPSRGLTSPRSIADRVAATEIGGVRKVKGGTGDVGLITPIARSSRKRMRWDQEGREVSRTRSVLWPGISRVCPGHGQPRNRAHNPKVVGSNPTPATNEGPGQSVF